MAKKNAKPVTRDGRFAAGHDRKSELLRGIKDTFPLVVGAIPFGIIFGAVAVTTGFSAWGTMGLSSLVLAGSAQFIAIGLVAQGVPSGFVLLTTFVVNLRHGVPEILAPGGDPNFTHTNAHLVSAMVAVMTAWWTRNLLATIVLGMVVFFVWRFLLSL